jgi:hypothetical protein
VRLEVRPEAEAALDGVPRAQLGVVHLEPRHRGLWGGGRARAEAGQRGFGLG